MPVQQEDSLKPRASEVWATDGKSSADDLSPLAMHGISVAYGGTFALSDVDFVVRPGTLTAIVGPNGAGKSTLLKAAIVLVPATGDVRFWGKPLNAVRGRIGYVPQRASVDWDFPVTAQQVVAMGLYSKIGWFRPVTRIWRNKAKEALHRVGLADLADRQIGQLSGGQQQRVFFARALAQEADLYLMDEPMAGIDAATERVIFDLLADCRAAGKTVVVVHHDLDTVPAYFDDVLLLNRKAIASGPISTTFTAANLKATYGGKIAVLDRSSSIAP
ncbi:MAG: metal ABC transporter ATP-binding protein [Planctomycetaceae bacterium]|nr:metal ABC transporter ATP-binding protein [Planctomycetaceae bacterium]